MASNTVYESHVGDHLRAVESKLKQAALVIGGMAEGYAKQYLTESGAVDTGLLRNSVTYGLEGERTAIDSYKADKGDATGHYDGKIPQTENGVVLVLGSNVEYAPYIELGTRSRAVGANGEGLKGGIRPRPYIRPALENHRQEYAEAIAQLLQG
jgi:hypothetical protein